jgi:hypothetical protein
MHRTPWLLSFFIGTPIIFLFSFFTLQHLENNQLYIAPHVLGSTTSKDETYVFSDLTPKLIISDARPIILKNYLHRYDSPLENYSRQIVQISDKYSLDFRLLVAIAQQESNLCKKIPPGSHNCWGYGIYGDLSMGFNSYPEAIETVAKGLKNDYIDYGLTTPEKIMAKYTPPSVEIGGPWAKGVSQFLSDLE